MQTTLQRLAAASLLFAFTVLSVTAQAQWLQSKKSEDIAYFLFNSSPRLERYSLVDQQWLGSINLPSVYGLPTTFWVDESGIYVAYGQTVKRYDLSGGNEAHLLNTAEPVQSLFTDGSLLLINRTSSYYARFTSLNKTNGNIIAVFETYIDSTYGASIAPSINKIFGRSGGISPSDITYVSYTDAGTFTGGGDSPHHGDYPGASKTWVFPGDSRVVDDSGTVYSTGDLMFLNSFGGSITDLDFYGTNIPIVLRGSNLIAYTSSLLPTGSRALSYAPKNIYLAGTNVLTFTSDTSKKNGIRVNEIPISTLNPPTPGQSVDPHGLSYTPDASFLDKNGILYLFSKTHQSLFRWDPINQKYLATIPLVDIPSYAAYSSTNHKIYIAYPSGLIRSIDLTSTNSTEVPFANLATAPHGLSTAGQYLFAMDESGAWGTHYTFDPAGVKVDSEDWNYYSTEFIWSEPNQKMYFLRDSTSPNDLLWEQINANGTAYADQPGGIGTQLDTPLHGDYGFQHPVRVSPDGSIVVLGSGVMHDAQTLARLPTSLANSVTDIAWTGGKIQTFRTIAGIAQLQEWNQPNYGQGIVRQIPGTAHRLLALDTNQLIVISLVGNKPSFHVMGTGFGIIAPPTLEPPGSLKAALVSGPQVNLTWNDVAGEENYSIERKINTGGNWQVIGTADTGTTIFYDGPISSGNVYFYRVIAKNGSKSSLPSAEVLVDLVVPAFPTNLSAVATSSTSILVEWDDVQYESNYMLQKKTGDAGLWTDLISLDSNTETHTVTGLAPNTEYFFRIRAYNAIGTSAFSAVVSATTDPALPEAPYISSVSANNAFSVSVYWYGGDYATGFVIERTTLPNINWEIVGQVGAVESGSSSFLDNTVLPLTDYQYRIYSTNQIGQSDYSNTESVTTPSIPPPDSPENLLARGISSSNVSISWMDVLGESGYTLQRRTENPNSWTNIATLVADTTSYEDTNVIGGTQYFYRIQAFNVVGWSNYSNEDEATPLDMVRLIEDDFDPSLDAFAWLEVADGIATNGGTGFRNGNALWFGGSGLRYATTIPLNVASGGSIQFFIRAGNESVDGNQFWNDSESGEFVSLEYSKDGFAWSVIEILYTQYSYLNTWREFSVSIPLGAYSPQTRFRWRQQQHSGAGYDTWALEDVSVQTVVPPPPQAPSLLVARNNLSGSITLLWTGVKGATSYVLERKEGSKAWASLATVPSSTTYFVDSDVFPLITYLYRVKAANAGGQSDYSPTAQVALTALLTVNANPLDCGGFVVDPPQPESGYVLGTEATVTALPIGTNVFSAWYGAKSTLSPEVSLTMNSHQTLNALYNNPGKLLFQNPGGQMALWFMDKTQRLASVMLRDGAGTSWRLLAAADFTQDNNADLVVRSPQGQMAILTMNGNTLASNVTLRSGVAVNFSWEMVGAGDFDNDGANDLLWVNTGTRKLAVWKMSGTSFTSSSPLRQGKAFDPQWKVVAAADFNRDGKGDVLFQRVTGEIAVWQMNGLALDRTVVLRNGMRAALNWKAIAAGDFNDDGNADVLFQNSNRQLACWYLEGINYLGGSYLNGALPVAANWTIRAVK